MDLITIAQALLRWGIPALAGAAILLAVLAGGYLVYKKVLHGRRTVTGGQALCAGLLLGWGLLVFCLTSLSRGANFTGSFNLDLFSGYRSAWNNWSVSELQLILFNMLMFAPLGFLLPLLWKRARRFRVTAAVSLAMTGGIEVFQLLTGTGIFELDDLVHNLLGSLFGYFCVMALLTLLREKRLRFAPIGKALLLPGLVGLILGVVFLAYARQPYGNMSILPAAPQDLSQVQLLREWELPDPAARASVYRSRYGLDRAYLQRIKAGLGALEGLTFQNIPRREDENLGYLGTDPEGSSFRLLFFYRTGEWSYTTFAEHAAQLTDGQVQTLRARYEDWMKEFGLLPEGAVFSLQNGDTLRWDVRPEQDPATASRDYQRGSVMIQFSETGALSSFSYQIVWNDYAATEPILTPEQAYAQVEQGNFSQYVPFQPGDRLHVTGCQLVYLYDTKGFAQPAYEFSGFLNSSDNLWVCRIPALTR